MADAKNLTIKNGIEFQKRQSLKSQTFLTNLGCRIDFKAAFSTPPLNYFVIISLF